VSSASGCFLRVKRDGLWVNVGVEDLTPREFDRIFSQMGRDSLQKWVDQLRNAIRPYGERCALRALSATMQANGMHPHQEALKKIATETAKDA
jgi:hypothetical protein